MADLVVRIGTRSSELALRQAHQVAAALHANGIASELVTYPIGDCILDRPLSAIGEKPTGDYGCLHVRVHGSRSLWAPHSGWRG